LTPRVDSFVELKANMGKVIVKLRLANNGEWFNYERKLSRRKPRQIEVEALVDTGATRLYLKPSVIKALALRKVDEIQSRTTNGTRTRGVYDPVRLDLMGRHGTFDVVDIDEQVPNLLGQIPLEYLDLVVDSQRRKLIPNPAHGGTQMTEEY
jgi:predicted aspartyl protease